MYQHASKRDIEQLFRTFKAKKSAFKQLQSKKCEPKKLTEHFKRHFTAKPIETNPIEVEEIPDFLKALQNMCDGEILISAPDLEEIQTVIKSMKNGKSATDVPMECIKHAINCKEFSDELIQLYATIWETKQIPREWGYSKLVALWKGHDKGKASNPETQS